MIETIKIPKVVKLLKMRYIARPVAFFYIGFL